MRGVAGMAAVAGLIVAALAGLIVAAGCGRGPARGPSVPVPVPVPVHFAALFAGDRTLTYAASHGETPTDGSSGASQVEHGRLRCAQQVAVIGELHAARITCEVEGTPPGRDGGEIGDDRPSFPIELDVEGRYVTDGVGLWRDDHTEPWPPPLDELRALVRTPALIGGVPVPGRDDHPTEVEEARGYYHEVYRDDDGGLCGADVSTGSDTAVLAWCVDGAHGLDLVNRGFDGASSREDQATLRVE